MEEQRLREQQLREQQLKEQQLREQQRLERLRLERSEMERQKQNQESWRITSSPERQRYGNRAVVANKNEETAYVRINEEEADRLLQTISRMNAEEAKSLYYFIKSNRTFMQKIKRREFLYAMSFITDSETRRWLVEIEYM